MDGRNGEVWKRYSVHRWTQERIAEHFGITQGRVSQIIKEVSEGLTTIDKSALIQQSLDLLSHVQAEALEIAAMTPAPVVRGKDGTILYEPEVDENGEPKIDPMTGEVIESNRIVRDYSGRLRALETAAKMDAEIAKRFGINAPERHEVQAKVNYSVEGLDPAELM